MFETVLLIEEMKKLKAVTEERIRRIESRVEGAPEGCLQLTKKWNQYQYYQKTGKSGRHGIYISRKEQSTAVALAQKAYDLKLIKELEKQRKAVERFLEEYDPDAAKRVYEVLSEPRKQLVKPLFMSDEEFVRAWQSVPYQHLGFDKNEPEYFTARGERVRSKSEILIADALYRNNIPYRYEFPVYHNGVVMAAPDFNCLNVRLREEYYWEHLGLMGNENYADRNVKKIEKYTLAGDFDETRLILTMETDKKPLNTRVIEEKIRRYLL